MCIAIADLDIHTVAENDRFEKGFPSDEDCVSSPGIAQPASYDHCGFLERTRTLGVRSARCFVVFEHSQLKLFKESEAEVVSTATKGENTPCPYLEIDVANSYKHPKNPLAMMITSSDGKEYTFTAESSAERDTWITSVSMPLIRRVICDGSPGYHSPPRYVSEMVLTCRVDSKPQSYLAAWGVFLSHVVRVQRTVKKWIMRRWGGDHIDKVNYKWIYRLHCVGTVTCITLPIRNYLL